MTVILEVKSFRQDAFSAFAKIEAKMELILARMDEIASAQAKQQSQIDTIFADVQAIKAAVTSQPATNLRMILGEAIQQGE